MRQPTLARIALMCALILSTTLMAATGAITFAQNPDPAQAPVPARVALVHAAPFAAGPATVSVFLNDILVDSSFNFGDTIGYLNVAPGTYRVRIFAGSFSSLPTGETPAIDVPDVTLETNTDYTVAAIGGANGYPLELLPLVDRTPTTPPPASAEGQVRVVHAAPFAPAIVDTAVDVVPDAGGPALLTNFRYRDNSSFVTLPSGVSIDLQVRLAGTSTVAIDLPPVSLSPGQRLTVFAIGDNAGGGGNQTVQPLVLPAPLQTERAQVRLVHAAPFASGDATATVTLNGAVVKNNLTFGRITPYSAVPAGAYAVEIFAGTAATGTPAFSGAIVLQPGVNYTAVAIGKATPTYPVNVLLLTDDPTPPAEARLRAVHAAPFAPTVPQNRVDIVTDSGTTVVPDLDYASVTPYLDLLTGTPFNLRVVPEIAPQASIILPTITFSSGQVVTAIAVGDLVNQTPTVLFLDDRSVTQQLFLPFIAR